MKMLLTLDFPPAHGGIQRYLHSIASHTYTTADTVLVGAPGPCEAFGVTATVERHTFPLSSRYNKLALVTLLFRYLALGRRTDVHVECGNVYAALVAWAARPFVRRPYRVYAYGTELIGLCKPGLRRALLRSALHRAEVVYVLGDYTASLVRAAGVSTPTVTIPPRLDVSRVDVDAAIIRRQSQTKRTTGPMRILSVSRLVPHKGQAVLLDAVSRIAPSIAWQLTIVGQGPQEAHLRRKCADLGIANRVEFRGGLSDAELTEEYNRADAFVLASVEQKAGTEGFGIVLLEAMSHGVPIVASRCGGIPDVVGDCGVLVEPGNAPALTAALTRLASDPTAAADLAVRAARRLCDRFIWN